MIKTTHIQEMLGQSLDACETAEKIQTDRSLDPYLEKNRTLRLLEGAAINARHAAAEIEDELFRYKHGDNGFNPYTR